MKRITILTILCLLLAVPCFAQEQLARMSGPMLGSGGGGSGSEIFGYNSIEASTATGASNGLHCSSKSTVSHGGKLSTIEIYMACSSATADFKVGLYTDSSNVPTTKAFTEKVFNDIGSFSAQWYSFDMEDVDVPAGTYWICVNTNAGTATTLYYDVGSANSRQAQTLSYATSWHSTMEPDSTSTAILSRRGTVTWG